VLQAKNKIILRNSVATDRYVWVLGDVYSTFTLPKVSCLMSQVLIKGEMGRKQACHCRKFLLYTIESFRIIAL
jgi:hypothetical protein